MIIQCSGEDSDEGNEEAKTPLSRLHTLVPQLLVEGFHNGRHLSMQQGERAEGRGVLESVNRKWVIAVRLRAVNHEQLNERCSYQIIGSGSSYCRSN